MGARPSNEQFIQWAINDRYKSKLQNALRKYPDLANIKNSVSFNILNYLMLVIVINDS